MVEERQDGDVRLRRPIAFLYPPQPLEPCPMPGDLLAHFPRLATLHTDVLASLDWDAPLRRDTTLSWPISMSSIQQVRGAHVGVVAFGWVLTQTLAEAGVTPDVVFGHSLGLHTALAVAEATPVTDALDVVDRTAQFLAQKHDEVTGAMLAVIGFTPDEVTELCEQIEPPTSLFVAIINSRRQVVMSGLPASIERLAKHLRLKQVWKLTEIRSLLPLHSPLMAPLAERCAELVERAHCHVPHIRMIHPTTAELVHNISKVEWLWRGHLLAMIDFVRALDEMERLGVQTYIEVGVGETLTQLGRWYRRDLPILSTSKPERIERILHARVE
jgi:[acyl-carrier-protein] S-malonyltransferase